jgi:2-polyprenyl-3-methyl-5-hydroxy-6-metoxy-1,4-benzoquinol methylase
MPAGYRVLPEIYDRWQATYGSDFSSVVLPRLLTTLDRFPIPETMLADIACGTGTLAIAMALRGWQVWGIDASQGMVDASRRKAEEFSQSLALSTRDTRNVAQSAAFSARDLPNAMQTLVFSCQDMRHFVLPVRDL